MQGIMMVNSCLCICFCVSVMGNSRDRQTLGVIWL